jgi:1-acyl-sn-glycerol-3-phosphate acyltransferase
MAYRFVSWIFSVLIRTLSKSSIEGQENLPSSGAYLLIANHMSMVDIPLGFAYMADPNISGWAAAKWARHPLLAPIVRIGGGVFIQRGEVDRTALQAALDWLKSGKPFALSPEGTRSRDTGLQRGKTGAAYLAAEADVPVIPVGVIGTDQAFRTLLLRFRRPELLLRVGEPFKLPPLDEVNRNQSLRRNTDELMCRIAALLPERYWGYYADHPRLKELLAEQNNESAAEQEAGNLVQ